MFKFLVNNIFIVRKESVKFQCCISGSVSLQLRNASRQEKYFQLFCNVPKRQIVRERVEK